jgi:hypothetical protein
MSSTFQTASPSLQKLDPLKRVNYTFGLVLGVEEFLQSDTYFLAKHYLENRLLHGYGTVCGLDVTVQTGLQLEVQVTPGWAINPKGQEIYVPQLMCVQVNDWLQANQSALEAALPGPAPSTLNLCVVLCYRECKTDVVPIPGEPCQTQSSSTAPSRIADSFELMLCLDRMGSPPLGSPPLGSSPSGTPGAGGLCEFRPPQLEDDAIRAVAWLLSQLQVSTTGPFLTSEQLVQLVLDLGTLGSPPFLASPPAGPPYAVHASDLSQFRRAALRTWITKVRPFIAAQQGAGPCCPPPERCVLLAELYLNLNSGWIASSVSVDDSLRPFLIPTRLAQEFFIEDPEAATAPVAPTANCVGITAVLGNPIAPATIVGGGGASGPYTFTATGLPPGLTMSSSGTISGTPTATGAFNYTVRVKDSAGNTGTVTCSVTVTAAPTAACVSITAVQNTAIKSATMAGSGGAGGPYTFTATGLPTGLTMSSTGTIAGTPTATGTFSYTVTVKDSAGNTGTVTCSVTVGGAS